MFKLVRPPEHEFGRAYVLSAVLTASVDVRLRPSTLPKSIRARFLTALTAVTAVDWGHMKMEGTYSITWEMHNARFEQ